MAALISFQWFSIDQNCIGAEPNLPAAAPAAMHQRHARGLRFALDMKP